MVINRASIALIVLRNMLVLALPCLKYRAQFLRPEARNMAIFSATHLFHFATAFCASVAIAENFDPALADPRWNLTCLGDSYPLNLPMIGAFNPNLVTMQQLCAKPQYNGGQPGQHIGGWCSTPPAMNLIAFDISAAAQVNTALANERVMLACRYKCFCNYELDDPQIQPENWHLFSGLTYIGRWWSYDLTLDIVNDFTDRTLKVQPPRPGLTMGIQVLLDTQDDDNYMPSWIIGLNPANDITCRGDLPAFPVPLPFVEPNDYDNDDYPFADLQALCANQMSGGTQ